VRGAATCVCDVRRGGGAVTVRYFPLTTFSSRQPTSHPIRYDADPTTPPASSPVDPAGRDNQARRQGSSRRFAFLQSAAAGRVQNC
jgi:hypothetical protein